MGTAAKDSKNKQPVEYAWKDRKHWAWFPFSFTRYAVADDRLYITRGFLSKVYDETLLYRVTDISLRRSLGQRIFGTGTIILNTRVDHEERIELKNIKHSVKTRTLLSQLIEDSRHEKNVVGKEFYGSDPVRCGHPELHHPGGAHAAPHCGEAPSCDQDNE